MFVRSPWTRFSLVRSLLLSAALVLWAAVAAPALFAAELPPAAARSVDFEKDVRPIFQARCLACHGPEKQESNYRLDRKAAAFQGGDYGEAAIVAGESDKGLLLKFVAGLGDTVMPPKGPRLKAEEVGLLRAWIEQGASWPDDPEAVAESRPTTTHWSFQPVRRSAPPALRDPFVANPIDAFILDKLHQAQLAPSPSAARAALIRRLYLDVLGLPPAADEVQAFAADASPDAWERLVDRVLASPHYGERWAPHWLDVVRFAETNGFETNTPRPNAWPYRDWVVQAFNRDLPYDQFIQRQIAGDALGDGAGTGFLVGGAYDQVKSPDPNLTQMQRQDELADMISVAGGAFLGLTVGCARCHNHKFDPILQKDYYALQAVFAGVQHGDRALPQPSDPARDERLGPYQKELAARRAELARLEAQAATVAPGRVLVIDDEDLDRSPGVTLLAPKAGHGENPLGSARGQAQDPGDIDRFPNVVSRGRYTWWENRPNADLIAYSPGAAGRFRVWVSWGAGWATHTKEAQYLLDLDGDLATTEDRQVLVTVDQQRFAGEKPAGPLPNQPLWSGFASAGVHTLQAGSKIVLHSGGTAPATTADAIVLEEVTADPAIAAAEPALPRLRPAPSAKINEERFAATTAKFVRFTVLSTNGAEPCLDELEIYRAGEGNQPAENVALATAGAKASSSGDYPGNAFHRLEHVHDGRVGNEYSWISNTAGRGWVQIELPQPTSIDRIVWGRDRNERYADRTALNYTIEVALEPGQWREVASSRDRIPTAGSPGAAAALRLAGLDATAAAKARQLMATIQSLEASIAALTRPSLTAYAGNFGTPGPTYRLYRGDPFQPRERVTPDALAVLGSLDLKADAPEQARRLALARWITQPDNPLVARVMVNRLWQHHFGAGIVPTPSDFGKNGIAPSHPELLDWLAGEFIAGGWSLKSMHRLILTSSTYRQSSAPRAEAIAKDAQSRLLWRYPPRRLEAEIIRDNVLVATGALDLRMGGPGFSAFEPNSNYVRVYNPKESYGPAEWRRMVYMTKVRMQADGVFGPFDCPDAGQPAPRRSQSTTPLQALNLLNSTFILQQSQLLAERVEREADSPPARVARAFERVLGRRPDAEEAAAAEQLVAEHGLVALGRALFNSNEFLFVP